MERDALASYLEQLLKVSLYTDYAPNGLQVEGKRAILRICTAVSASYDVIQEAAAKKADALIVHHGYFWKGEPPELVGIKKRRISALLASDMNLFAYHLPLDCHFELGNNACLAARLQVSNIERHSAQKTPDLLWSGTLEQPQSFQQFTESLSAQFGAAVQGVEAKKGLIHKIAWCSGAAQDFIEDAARLGVDAYISGEVSERTYYQAKELGIHYFACGHHATERYGVQALGEHLALEFGVAHQYIEANNPF